MSSQRSYPSLACPLSSTELSLARPGLVLHTVLRLSTSVYTFVLTMDVGFLLNHARWIQCQNGHYFADDDLFINDDNDLSMDGRGLTATLWNVVTCLSSSLIRVIAEYVLPSILLNASGVHEFRPKVISQVTSRAFSLSLMELVEAYRQTFIHRQLMVAFGPDVAKCDYILAVAFGRLCFPADCDSLPAQTFLSGHADSGVSTWIKQVRRCLEQLNLAYCHERSNRDGPLVTEMVYRTEADSDLRFKYRHLLQLNCFHDVAKSVNIAFHKRMTPELSNVVGEKERESQDVCLVFRMAAQCYFQLKRQCQQQLNIPLSLAYCVFLSDSEAFRARYRPEDM